MTCRSTNSHLCLRGVGRFVGVHGFFQLLERKKYKLHVRVMLSKYRGYALCPECKGQRLRAEARAVRVGDGKCSRNICEAAALTIRAAYEFFQGIELSPMQQEIAGSILHEIQQRLHFLDAVGLDYLTLDRLASTLSGGESQRIQLATSLGSRLVGALYVLDEPSIGLHTRDTAKLIRILENLRDLGNTILVVEHDPDVLRSADYLLDLGPGAGEFGGQLLAAGTVAEIERNPDSITGKISLRAAHDPGADAATRGGHGTGWMLRGARANNLRGLDVEIPLGMLVCITGVSGSGKSTLVHEVLYRVIAHELGKTDGGDPANVYRVIKGTSGSTMLCWSTRRRSAARRDRIRLPTSRPSTRSASSLPRSRRRSGAATPGHFSFNVPGGRCDVCEGDGTVTVEMQFLADVELPCEECNGTRYQGQRARGPSTRARTFTKCCR